MVTETIEMERRGSYARAMKTSDLLPSDSVIREERKKKASSMKVNGMTITMKDLSYSVDVPLNSNAGRLDRFKNCCKRTLTERKEIIRGISGTFTPGKMVALMGPSGAGKSTLLDVLALRKRVGHVDGQLEFNGAPPGKDFRRIVGYVEQNDILIGMLTVREIILYAAQLRLPSTLGPKFISERAEEVIEELELESCADTVIGTTTMRGISGGQAKRVNIALELVTNPDCFFLDEPTTGLDSATSLEVMTVVRRMVSTGRSCVCTIHQPPPDVFALFDQLLLLVAGRTVFLGPIVESVPYFESFGFVCPPKANRAEFLVGITGQGTGHALCEGPIVEDNFFANEYAISQIAQDRAKSNMRTTELLHSSLNRQEGHAFVNNAFFNFTVLFRRFLSQRIRDKQYVLARVVRVLIMCVILSSLFNNQPPTADGAFGLFSIFNFTVMSFAFGAISFIASLIDQRQMFIRERYSGSYQVISYYLGMVLSEVPFSCLQVLIWGVFCYWIPGLRANAGAFFTFMLVAFMVSETGLAMAQTFAAIASDYEVANSMMFPIIIMSVLFAGFYVRASLIPKYWLFAYYGSYLGYAFNAIAINQFPLDGPNFIVNETSPGFKNNRDLLKQYGVGEEGAISNLWGNIGVLFIFLVFWRTICYIAILMKKF